MERKCVKVCACRTHRVFYYLQKQILNLSLIVYRILGVPGDTQTSHCCHLPFPGSGGGLPKGGVQLQVLPHCSSERGSFSLSSKIQKLKHSRESKRLRRFPPKDTQLPVYLEQSAGRGRQRLVRRYRKGLTPEVRSVRDPDGWLIFCKLGRLLFWNAECVAYVHVQSVEGFSSAIVN